MGLGFCVICSWGGGPNMGLGGGAGVGAGVVVAVRGGLARRIKFRVLGLFYSCKACM